MPTDKHASVNLSKKNNSLTKSKHAIKDFQTFSPMQVLMRLPSRLEFVRECGITKILMKGLDRPKIVATKTPSESDKLETAQLSSLSQVLRNAKNTASEKRRKKSLGNMGL